MPHPPHGTPIDILHQDVGELTVASDGFESADAGAVLEVLPLPAGFSHGFAEIRPQQGTLPENPVAEIPERAEPQSDRSLERELFDESA